MRLLTRILLVGVVVMMWSGAMAREFHVAPTGRDDASGQAVEPLRTIQRAADLAQPGDVITVHAGVYRERVNPPRGGESEEKRIVYQAAPGEKVEIKGSELVKGWVKVEHDTWKVTLPNSFFGNFNPFADIIQGSWFRARGWEHHTGAVYLDGQWLSEAANLQDVLRPFGVVLPGFCSPGRREQLSIAWLQPLSGSRVAATNFTTKQGTRQEPCSEGGGCVSGIEHGNWLRYEKFDFAQETRAVEIRAASAAYGGIVELRMDQPDGELLGTGWASNTGGRQSWSTFKVAIKPTSGVRTLCVVFLCSQPVLSNPGLWFAKVDNEQTTIWAQFKGSDPNTQLVEVNARQTVFYPDKPGRNYITVRGFIMRHAATNWAPPNSEQKGLIGTHWSKGWIIENNIVSHSVCTGITLGKYGDEFDSKSGSVEAFVDTVKRALEYSIPWNKEHIGHHIVRNNRVSDCEQAGIVGSLGAIGSKITGNTIHDIWVRRNWGGAEQAGLKLHGAIDVEISQNHIYRTTGIWLDLMTQGTRVSRNLLHDNSPNDLKVEVNHGPFIVDNNLMLSRGHRGVSLMDLSQGGAYLHNVFLGSITSFPDARVTPYHPAHSTAIAGLKANPGGDNRFFNNIFVGDNNPPPSVTPKEEARGILVGDGLWVYDDREFPTLDVGNVYFNGARPYAKGIDSLVLTDWNPESRLLEESGRSRLQFSFPEKFSKAKTAIVTTERLGKAMIPQAPYVNPDGSPLSIDVDYFGNPRNTANPTPGPFENPGTGRVDLKVWPQRADYCEETAKAMPPNIILILTDDQGYADVGVNGHPVLKTPNMDRLANEGLRFTQFQACAECAPTRAGIMTGRNPFKIGVTHTVLGKYYLPEAQKTLADLLKEAGYQTAIVGKWHLGTHLPSRPQDKGFDYSFIHEGGALTALQNCPWKQSWLNPGFVRNGIPVKTQGFGTDVEINDSIRWLKTERDANRPFFLYLACSAPHDPYTPPAADMQRFLDMGWDPRLAGFYGLIENLDRHLGRLMEYMESSGLAENTLVVFMGDNGTAASHHKEWAQNGLVPWNAGLYGGKSWGGAEGALRVPCFIRWPGKIPPGSVSDELAAYYDLLPTFLDIAGAKELIPESTDGISLKTYLMDVEHQSLPDRVIYNIGHLGLPPHTRDFDGVDFLDKVTARTEKYRQARRGGLFDVQSDPGQTNNLAKKYPERLKMLHEGVTGFWKESQAAALAPVHIQLGSSKQPVVMLTSADWRPLSSGKEEHVTGMFGHLNAQSICQQMIDWQKAGVWPKYLESVKDRLNGYWNVYFTRPGTYEFRATLTPSDVRDMVQLKEGRVWLVVNGKAVCEAPVNSGSHEAVLHWNVDEPFRGEIQVRWSGQLPFDAELGAFVCDVERLAN